MPKQSAPANAAVVAESLKASSAQLKALIAKLVSIGDKPISADVVRDLNDLATAIRQAITATSPSEAAEKADIWPKDLADEAAGDLDWGADPEGLHG